MQLITLMLLSGSFIACGDKEEDTLEPSVQDTGAGDTDTDTDDTDDTEDTDTQDTDTNNPDDPLTTDDDGDGLSENDGDCDDTDPALNLADVDTDGVTSCDGDCDDTDASRYPGAPDDTDDGIDNDCDGDVDEDFVPGNNGSIDDVTAGGLVISEIMNNPGAVADEFGEWFEVYNATSDSVDLQGLMVSDAGSDTFTISSSVIVPAGGYAVIGNNADATTNGGVTLDYAYVHSTEMTLSNGDDEIILTNANGLIDEVFWDGGEEFPDAGSYSMNLDPGSLDSALNDDGANWCYGSDSLTSGDKGTPGTSNSPCLPPPTWVNDVQPIFQSAGCTGCHSAQMPDLATLLTIVSGDYNASVNAATTNGGNPMPWITPYSLGSSYLLYKIEGTQANVTGGGGGQMGSLSSQDIDTVRMWILYGAE